MVSLICINIQFPATSRDSIGFVILQINREPLIKMLGKLGFLMVLVTVANALIDSENDVLQKMTR